VTKLILAGKLGVMESGFQFHSDLLNRAVAFALQHHGAQVRKVDGRTPYVAHLMGVAFLLLRAGYDDQTVAAGLLHDVLEDTEVEYDELERAFGARIAEIVQGVTEDKRLPWEARKQLYVRTVAAAAPEVKAVCAADKINNLCSIAAAHTDRGPAVWQVFKRGREAQLGFYDATFEAIASGWSHPLLADFRRALEQVRHLPGPA
jgi:(p)ppGpp synthase/HD superfamily hydrolase